MAFMWTRSWRCLYSVLNRHSSVISQGLNRQGWFSLRSKFFATASKKKVPHRHLLLYGMAAFLWERERIPEDEIHRCLQYYEERVKATGSDRLQSPSSSSSNTAVASSWFTWPTRHSQEAQSTKQPEKPCVDEKEQKHQEFVNELTIHYSKRTQEQRSKYPLVGMKKNVPIRYQIGSLVLKKTKSSVANLVKHATALTQVTASQSQSPDLSLQCCEHIGDLACLEVEPHYHHNLVGDWVPVSMDAELTNQFQASGYPLVGLQKKHSKVMEKLGQVNLSRLHNSLENFMHTFDAVGIDSILDYSVVYRANALFKSLIQRTLSIANKFIQEEHNLTNIGLNDNFNSPNSELELSTDAFLSDWELFIKEPAYLVYRKPYADTGLYQFKVIGTYDDVTAKDFYEVQVAEELRMSWDQYATTLKTVDSDASSGCNVVHWVMKFPFPMSSREYVYVHKSWVSPQDNAIVFINRSVAHPSIPESSSTVRVKDYYSEMVIKAHYFIDEPGLNYELTYFDDPQVHIPTSCANWVANSAMPEFLRKVHNAAVARQNTREQVLVAT